MPKLTKALVAAIEPPETGSRTTWDMTIRGFGVRASCGGTKTYVLKYRNTDGRVRWLTLGRVGGPTLDEARAAASKAQGQVAAGRDPASEKSATRKAETVRQLLDLYEQEGLFVQRGIHQGKPLKPGNAENTMAQLRNHVIPLIGSHKASSVTPADIEKLARDIAGGRTAREITVVQEGGRKKRSVIRGGEGAGRKVVRLLQAVFSFAQRRGIVMSNPCELARIRKTDNQRTRFLSLAEMKKLGEAIEALAEEGVNPKALNITRLAPMNSDDNRSSDMATSTITDNSLPERMDLRDWFAGQFLGGMGFLGPDHVSPEDTAAAAYRYADAMLAARDQSS